MNIDPGLTVEDRVQIAVENFKSGYNCAQSVLLAYADITGLDQQSIKILSVSLGGGIARMREVCGAVNAMAILSGFIRPVDDFTNQRERTSNYRFVQELANQFRQLNGSIVCRELLSLKEAAKTNPEPSHRTDSYYKERPCSRFIADAAYIIGREIEIKL